MLAKSLALVSEHDRKYQIFAVALLATRDDYLDIVDYERDMDESGYHLPGHTKLIANTLDWRRNANHSIASNIGLCDRPTISKPINVRRKR